MYRPMALTGRCANGAEKDGGRVVHLAESQWGIALCGAKPGRLSCGFNDLLPEGTEATCRGCLTKQQKREVVAR